MTSLELSRPGSAELEAARLLLARLGISASDLMACAPATAPAPTFAEYVPVVSQAVGTGTRRVYGSYWNRIVAQWGHRRITEPTPSEIMKLVEDVKGNVVVRRNARSGRGAAEHLIASLRCLYNRVVADGLIAETDNPARKVAKPRRLPSTRRAVPNARLAEINHVAATTGNDPGLDSLILRLHAETACRRGGALALRPMDLDPDQCLILLREKGDTVGWQPVSPTLMSALLRHGQERGAQLQTSPVLGCPIGGGHVALNLLTGRLARPSRARRFRRSRLARSTGEAARSRRGAACSWPQLARRVAPDR